jgi:pimeloyl-ACP methyl ester carboxylesterase
MFERRTVTVDDLELATFVGGDGPPILFVHGFPLDHGMWKAQIEALHGWRIIAPDLRGFGASESSPATTTMGRFAADLHETLDQLGVREPVVFVGLSMGGYVAWPFMKQRPERTRALVLADTRVIADDAKTAAGRREMAENVLDRGVEVVEASMLEKLFSASTHGNNPAAIEAARAMIRAAKPQGVAGALLGMAERPDVSDRLASLSVPTLVVVGEDDGISSPTEMEGFSRAIRGATFVRIPNAGHMSPMENPKAFNEALTRFLKSLPKG